ncbi:zinc ribbon domain-containing protein [Geomonas sp. Red32]|uniref:FmdB family zinc ribbon protein n=1 Tax=Geomonas sp. Red32 TaxID=2912856 RepID=UPI00202CB254|nr:zinc ribbon domain-containing protein [Geomonas sp. Red32]MCM0080919.1 zinc ribbon domain-containing protein [Geomonas sp. Red32]
MPIYEFQCVSCDHRFEKLCKSEGSEAVTCPACGSSEVRKVMSSFAAPASGSCRPSSGGG